MPKYYPLHTDSRYRSIDTPTSLVTKAETISLFKNNHIYGVKLFPSNYNLNINTGQWPWAALFPSVVRDLMFWWSLENNKSRFMLLIAIITDGFQNTSNPIEKVWEKETSHYTIDITISNNTDSKLKWSINKAKIIKFIYFHVSSVGLIRNYWAIKSCTSD